MGDSYQGIERRNITPCPLHEGMMRDFEQGEKRMDRYETKIDDLLTGQSKQALSIQILNDAIGDGIRGDLQRTVEGVEGIKKKVDEMCTNFNNRLKIVETFSWFGIWITSMRNHLFQNVLKLAFAGGALYALFYFGGKLIGG